MELNNREAAAAIWLLVGLTFVIYKGAIREALIDVLRVALHPKLVTPLAGSVLYIGLLCFVASRLNLWHSGLTKDTVIWFIVSGFVLFIGVAGASKQRGFFRSVVRRAITATVALEFFLNLFVFAFIIELLVQPIIALLAVMSFVAGMEERHRPVRRLVDGTLSVIGLTLILYVGVRLSGEWRQIDVTESALALALPVWLTVAVVPFVFILSLYSTYELAFVRIDIAASNKRTWRMKLALLRSFHFRTVQLERFSYPWLSRLARASSYGEARRIIVGYREEDRD